VSNSPSIVSACPGGLPAFTRACGPPAPPCTGERRTSTGSSDHSRRATSPAEFLSWTSAWPDPRFPGPSVS
jgi:hypothetical protein